MKQINNNIKESYVSFNTAKLLKFAKFNVPCTHYYFLGFSMFEPESQPIPWKMPPHDGENLFYLSSVSKGQFFLALAPTYDLALAWIKLNFDLDITPVQDWDHGVLQGYNSIIERIDGEDVFDVGTFPSLNEAKDASIAYVLTNNKLV